MLLSLLVELMILQTFSQIGLCATSSMSARVTTITKMMMTISSWPLRINQARRIAWKLVMIHKIYILAGAPMFFMLRFRIGLNIRKVLLCIMRMIMMNLSGAFMTHEVWIHQIVTLGHSIEQELSIYVNIFCLKIDTGWYSLLRVLILI